ncbi:MAG: TlpA family protein disulfide reductase [Bradyrhizobiaceae bacterium]|nr:TlpA family protein disulfide reductase [Bradyrhizobiaceae bacterium]
MAQQVRTFTSEAPVLQIESNTPTEIVLLYRDALNAIAKSACALLLKSYWNRSPDEFFTNDVVEHLAWVVNDPYFNAARSSMIQAASEHLQDLAMANPPSLQFLQYLDSAIGQCDEPGCLKTVQKLHELKDALRIRRVPELTGLNLAGEKQKMILSNSRYTVVHFWGSWCGPCLESNKALAQLQDSLASMGVEMVHYAVENPSRFESWKKHAAILQGQSLMGSFGSGSVASQLAIRNFPSWMIVDSSNAIVGRFYSISDAVAVIKSLDSR